MVFDILTLFPEMFVGPLSASIVRRAQEQRKVKINLHNLRDYAIDKRGSVDGRPFGGGAGMIIRVDVVDKALENVECRMSDVRQEETRTLLLSPKGTQFTQQKAQEFSKLKRLVLICGHYEGFDQRIHDHLVDEEISIGPYILTGGELPAMVIVDAITRLIPNVIKKESLQEESFVETLHEASQTKVEYPQYTHPREYKGWKVPEVLLSGNHREIRNWREEK